MRPTEAALVWIVIGLCVLGATRAMAARPGGRRSRLQVVVRFDPPDACEIVVADQTFRLPADQDRVVATLRALRDGFGSMSITGSAEIPYRCIGLAIFLAQRSGFRRIDLATAPVQA